MASSDKAPEATVEVTVSEDGRTESQKLLDLPASPPRPHSITVAPNPEPLEGGEAVVANVTVASSKNKNRKRKSERGAESTDKKGENSLLREIQRVIEKQEQLENDMYEIRDQNVEILRLLQAKAPDAKPERSQLSAHTTSPVTESPSPFYGRPAGYDSPRRSFHQPHRDTSRTPQKRTFPARNAAAQWHQVRYEPTQRPAGPPIPDCNFCGQVHWSSSCTVYRDCQSRSERLIATKKCFWCLEAHGLHECKANENVPCRFCKQVGHNKSLCHREFP